MGTSRKPPRLPSTFKSSCGSTNILLRLLFVTNLQYEGRAVSERVFLVRENLRRRTRPFVDEYSSWLTVTEDTDTFPLGLNVDVTDILWSCVTVSLWLSSEWLSSPEEQIFVTVVLVIVERVETALLSDVDATGVKKSSEALDGMTFVFVDTTVVMVVMEDVATWVMMVVSGSVVLVWLNTSEKSLLRLDSSAEGIGEGAIRMILHTGVALFSSDWNGEVLLRRWLQWASSWSALTSLSTLDTFSGGL